MTDFEEFVKYCQTGNHPSLKKISRSTKKSVPQKTRVVPLIKGQTLIPKYVVHHS